MLVSDWLKTVGYEPTTFSRASEPLLFPVLRGLPSCVTCLVAELLFGCDLSSLEFQATLLSLFLQKKERKKKCFMFVFVNYFLPCSFNFSSYISPGVAGWLCSLIKLLAWWATCNRLKELCPHSMCWHHKTVVLKVDFRGALGSFMGGL